LTAIIYEHAVAEFLDSLRADARSLIERKLDTYARSGKGDVIRSTGHGEVPPTVRSRSYERLMARGMKQLSRVLALRTLQQLSLKQLAELTGPYSAST
jgi:hypothetical protein